MTNLLLLTSATIHFACAFAIRKQSQRIRTLRAVVRLQLRRAVNTTTLGLLVDDDSEL